MRIFHFTGVLLLFMATLLAGCTDYDDTTLRKQVDDLEDRVAALETLTQQMNSTLTGVKTIVDAMNEGDYITAVTPITGGYRISFAKGEDIELFDGKTPAISVALDATDGNYYWTLDGKFMTDSTGKKIRANGKDGADAVAPELRINPDTEMWEISTDGHKTWVSTGVKATGEDGDSFFKSVDLTNATYVTFTLADGTSFKVDRSSSLYRMAWYIDDSEKTFWDGNTFTFPNCERFEFGVYLSTVDKKRISVADYGGIKATIESRSTTTSDVTTETRGVNRDQWKISVNGPIRYEEDNTIDIASVDVTPPAGAENETALLTLTFYDKKGNSVSKSCILRYNAPVIELAEAGSLESIVIEKGLTLATSMQIKGFMNQRDFEFIKKQMTVLTSLNLTDVTIKAYGEFPANTIPEQGLGGYADASQSQPEHNLRTIVLPRSITAIGNSAFAMCSNLQWLHFPEGCRVKTIGKWICERNGLKEIIIPASVSTFMVSAFWGAFNLEKITFEKGSQLTEIPDFCFMNTGLTSITFPESVKTIGQEVFITNENNFPNSELTYVDAPGVTKIGSLAFATCSELTTLKLGAVVTSFDAITFRILGFDDKGNINSYGEVLAPQCDLYIPASQIPASGNVWKNATWKSIQEY